ncbi:MAG: hypothetical protein GX754_00935 [Clostridiaceae bacterium]|nr:hypothetical protein [Clostridiaceae bacterium]
MTLEEVLARHINSYPEIQIQDMVKLIYQNEFGRGHFIKDKKASLLKLEQEFSSLKKNLDKGSNESNNAHVGELFEDIGNNLVRLNLLPLLTKKCGTGTNPGAGNNMPVELSTVNSFFVNTANSISGKKKRFEEKLGIFRKCCKDGLLPFTITEADNYLEDYRAKGYPPVSHSEIYRQAYRPAYRIVDARYRRFFDVFCRIDSLLRTRDRVNVAIDGNCCAGKSTLAGLIGNVYGCNCNIFCMDDFFLPRELKTKERLDEPGGNVDYERFREEVIGGINRGREFQYRKYDCRSGTFNEIVKVTPGKLNIIEGSYSMHPALVENYDLKIFLGIDEEEQRRRVLERNGPGMYEMFVQLWIPLENRYFSGLGIREQSDLVYNGAG